MALAKHKTTITIGDGGLNNSNHIGDYIILYGVSFDSTANPAYSEKKYAFYWGLSATSDPTVSGAEVVKITIETSDSANTIANKTNSAIGVHFTNSSFADNVVTVENTYVGNVSDSESGTASNITVANTVSGTGSFVSNVKYPENNAMYFIEGDKLAILSQVDSSGNQNTTARKSLKAIQENLVEGLMIQYYAEPNSVTAITDSLDIDNALELSVVDYVKKCLYMDKAGKTADPNVMQASMAMATKHERNFKEAIQRYGVRKKDKTGGSRVVKVPNLV